MTAPTDEQLGRQIGMDEWKRTTEARFARFHQAHPEVYDALVQVAREWRAFGRERWSIWGAFQVIRWQRRINGLPDQAERFKLSNDYTSRYARLIMAQEPDLEGIFELHALKGDTR